MEKKLVKIESKDSYGITWYEHAQPYLGSHRGMRFRIARNPMEDVSLKAPEDKQGASFDVTIWPEPFCFEETAEEEKKTKQFPFDMDGKEQLIAWLNEQYEERFDEWEKARAKY